MYWYVNRKSRIITFQGADSENRNIKVLIENKVTINILFFLENILKIAKRTK